MEFPVSNGRVQSNQPSSSESGPRNKPRGGATIQFEVAPDPDNQALAARWRRLPEDHKREITRGVARAIVPPALAALRVKGELIEQTGGFYDETNPSLSLRLPSQRRAIEVARFFGHVFAQKSVLVVSESRRKGLKGVEVIAIQPPEEFSPRQIAALYRRLRSLKLNDQWPITGHTTTASEMSIMNFSGIETEILKARIDGFLRGAFATEIRKIFTAAVDKRDYGYDIDRQVWPVASAQPPVLGWHDYLRWRAATILQAALAQYESNELARIAVPELKAA